MANLPEPARPAAAATRRPVLHPSLVRAAVSPTAVAATAVGAGIGVADHSLTLALILGVAGWVGRMSAAVVARRRRARAAAPRPAQLDPWSVPEPWRPLLRQAMAVQSRFDQAVAAWPDGPLHDHLAELQPRVWAQVDALGAAARQEAAAAGWTGAGVNRGPAEAEQLSEELRRVQAERSRLPEAAAGRRRDLERREEVLAAELQARHRATRTAEEARDRLRAAVARLDLTVTGLLQTGSPDSGSGVMGGPEPGTGPAGVTAALDGLSDEIASLQAALTETGGAPGARGAPPDPATP